ncbi:ABC transporter permease [Pilimelia terevasa]|uniref:ABC transporter permease n=1 Tax=Pilimelia terevasa TaxID=53372 RepID=A0A8J3BI36_9ACTN|nr:ABC transporter permease [Pilimelia terevasa]GGK12732.1 ABC transporter permease [Pilimelia terevasa]
MDGATIRPDLGYAVVLAALAVATAVLARATRLGVGRQILTASARAVAQLAVVSVVIVAVLRSAGYTALFVAAMLAIAAATSARRVGEGRPAWWVAVPLAVGTAPVLGVLLATGVVPRAPVAVVPVAGILIGGAMTSTSLAGRRALDALEDRFGEYEAALALGLTSRHAALEVCRARAAEALLPGLDQTRTVGLVTLPGAFVGVLLGGASPVEAGAAQLLVLVGLLAVQTVAVAATVELVARRRIPWRRG